MPASKEQKKRTLQTYKTKIICKLFHVDWAQLLAGLSYHFVFCFGTRDDRQFPLFLCFFLKVTKKTKVSCCILVGTLHLHMQLHATAQRDSPPQHLSNGTPKRKNKLILRMNIVGKSGPPGWWLLYKFGRDTRDPLPHSLWLFESKLQSLEQL